VGEGEGGDEGGGVEVAACDVAVTPNVPRRHVVFICMYPCRC
jgi:hypothetical protein